MKDAVWPDQLQLGGCRHHVSAHPHVCVGLLCSMVCAVAMAGGSWCAQYQHPRPVCMHHTLWCRHERKSIVDKAVINEDAVARLCACLEST